MAVICAYQSTTTSLTVNSCKQSSAMSQLRLTSTSALAITNTAAESNVFGGKYLDMASASLERAPMWCGFENTPATASNGFALLIRIIPRFSGTPAATDLFAIGGSTTQFPGRMNFAILSTGAFRFSYADMDGAAFQSLTTTAVKTDYTSASAVDLMFSWDGTTTANAVNFGVNGTAFQSMTAVTAMYTNVTQLHRTGITIGCGPNSALSNWDLNEFVIFDNATAVTIGSRTAFWTVTPSDASIYSSVSATNVISGTAYTYAGTSLTGSYTTASAANTKIGVVFGNSVTGSYTGADRWTDPGSTNVRLGTVYTANATSVTGSLSTASGTGLATRGGFYKTIG